MPANPTTAPWSFRTLADDPTHPLSPLAQHAALVARLAAVPVAMPGTTVAPPLAPPAPPATTPVSCPRCHRLVPPDLLADVRALPAALRTAAGWDAFDFVCDGCRGVADVLGQVSLHDLHVAQGAPADVLARVAAHDAEVRRHRGPFR